MLPEHNGHHPDRFPSGSCGFRALVVFSLLRELQASMDPRGHTSSLKFLLHLGTLDPDLGTDSPQ